MALIANQSGGLPATSQGAISSILSRFSADSPKAFRKLATILKDATVGFQHTYTFINSTSRPARVLLEEDPDGMMQAAIARLDDGIPVLGKLAEKRRKEVQEVYEQIRQLAEDRPVQESVLITDQLKEITMQSPIVRLTICVCDWSGVLKIYLYRQKHTPGDLPCYISDTLDQSKVITIRAESLYDAIPAIEALQTGALAPLPWGELWKRRPHHQALEEITAMSIPGPSPPLQLSTLYRSYAPAAAVQQPLHQPSKPATARASNGTRWSEAVTPPDRAPAFQHETVVAARGSYLAQGPAKVKEGQQEPLQSVFGGPSTQHLASAVPTEAQTAREPPIPSGFLPISGAVQVFSVSANRWCQGELAGLCVSNRSYPPGSVMVLYDAAPGERLHKVLLPQDFAQLLRR